MRRLNQFLSKHVLCEYVLYAAVVFLLFLLFINSTNRFDSDETEIFAKGQAIAMGKLLYLEVASQHMPLMYYFAALFSLLGCSSIYTFRFCFYGLMALLWSLIYVCYGKRLGKAAVGCTPLFFVVLATQSSLGLCVLSEQFQGIGYVILLCELLCFLDTHELSVGGSLMIGLAIILSFYAAFMSIFVIFFVWLTVLFIEIQDAVREKIDPLTFLGKLLKKYRVLIAAIVVPLVVMCGFYYACGSLGAFIGWAYTINRSVYGNYFTGAGSNSTGILGSMFYGLVYLRGYLGLREGYGAFGFDYVQNLVVLFLAIIFIAQRSRQTRNPVVACGLVLTLIASASRGVFLAFDGFHGIPFVILVSAYASFGLFGVLPCVRKWIRASSLGISSVLPALLVAFIVINTYNVWESIPNLFSISLASTSRYVGSDSYIIGELTEQGEEIAIARLQNFLYLDTGTVPAAATCGSTPWMWEWGGKEALEDLEANPPRIFSFNPDYVIWNIYSIGDYAPELCDFVYKNYTSLAPYGYDTIWVRNDYYKEALEILEPYFISLEGSEGSAS